MGLLFSSISLLYSFGILFATVVDVATAGETTTQAFDEGLRCMLSPNATVVRNTAVPRWSEFDVPTPGTVVTVATEKDVQVVVYIALPTYRKY